MSGRWFFAGLSVAMFVAGQPAPSRPLLKSAPAGRGPELIERFLELPPARQRELLERLPEARRQAFEQRIESYGRLSLEQRRQLRERFEHFRQLPVERQEELRRTFRSFHLLTPERQRAIRRELELILVMSDKERRRYLDSAGWQERFSPLERRLMHDWQAAWSLAPDPEEPGP